MISQLFTFPSTIERLRQGPLSEHLDAYAAAVAEQGYAHHSIGRQIVAIADFSLWLKHRHIEIEALDHQVVDRFLRLRRRQQRVGRGDPKALDRMLSMLRQKGIVEPYQPPVPDNARSKIAAGFQCYLLQELGRSPSTVKNYVPFIDQFLMERFQNRTPVLALLRAPDVTGFVTRHAHQLSPVRAGIMVTALRSFFRYLLHRGAITTDLAGCVPAVPNWSLSTLPRYLPATAVEKLLKRCDRKTAVGRRNHAILLLLARLGVRAGEVMKLSLDDIDWDSGQITIHGKGGKSAQLPLPADVGTALAAYLRRDRPPSTSRRVFLRHRAPLTGFANPSTLSSIVRRALKHAGIESAHTGAHVLRHSLATSLLRQGGSLDEIGELLRHQEIRELLNAAKTRPSIDPLRPWTYYCLFGLLAVTGLRLGEALNLRIGDIDWSENLLTIRGAKFGKSRLVPLHASTFKVLANYAKRRERRFGARTEGPFLVNQNDNRLDKGEVHRTFYTLSRQIGLRAVDASRGPRLHDFRHRFAVQTLLRWYRNGEDPKRRLPILSTYLGHAHVTDTYWYLTGTPELLRAAGERLEKRWEGLNAGLR